MDRNGVRDVGAAAMSVVSVLKIRHNGRDITGRDEDRPENVPVRAWRQIAKHSYFTAGSYWHENYLPLHFTRAAYFRYPEAYKRRTNAYYRRHHVDRETPRNEIDSAVRQARVDHKPLVFSGTLRDLSKHATAKAFQTRVTIRIPTPPYVGRRKATGNQPDIVAELSAVNSQEHAALSALVQRTAEGDLQRYADSKTLPAFGR